MDNTVLAIVGAAAVICAVSIVYWAATYGRDKFR